MEWIRKLFQGMAEGQDQDARSINRSEETESQGETRAPGCNEMRRTGWGSRSGGKSEENESR